VEAGLGPRGRSSAPRRARAPRRPGAQGGGSRRQPRPPPWACRLAVIQKGTRRPAASERFPARARTSSARAVGARGRSPPGPRAGSRGGGRRGAIGGCWSCGRLPLGVPGTLPKGRARCPQRRPARCTDIGMAAAPEVCWDPRRRFPASLRAPLEESPDGNHHLSREPASARRCLRRSAARPRPPWASGNRPLRGPPERAPRRTPPTRAILAALPGGRSRKLMAEGWLRSPPTSSTSSRRPPGLDRQCFDRFKQGALSTTRTRCAFIVHGPRPLPHPSPPTARCSASRWFKGDMIPRAARHPALVRPLRRPHDPRHPPVPGHLGLDAALHTHRLRGGPPSSSQLCFGPQYFPARPGL